MMNKEQLPAPQNKRAKLAAVGAIEGALIGISAAPLGVVIGAVTGGLTAYAAEPLVSTTAEYIRTVGWLAQMDPTYPHTEFHPYEAPVLPAEPMPAPEPMAG